MQNEVIRELATLQRMSVGELQAKYAEVFGEATRARHKTWLQKRIAWRLQANTFGGLTERATRRAMELANEADLRVTEPRARSISTIQNTEPEPLKRLNSLDSRLPPVNNAIRRDYKGKEHLVIVLENRFEYEGKQYKTLSAIAKEITGQHWNGFRFFNLNRSKAST